MCDTIFITIILYMSMMQICGCLLGVRGIRFMMLQALNVWQVEALLSLSLNNRKRLGMIQWSACARDGKHVSSSMNSPRSRSLRSTSEPQVVIWLIFIIANLVSNTFRPVDQVLPTMECIVVSTLKAPKVGHVAFRQLRIFLKVLTDDPGCGVERRGYEVC